jgi:hypothetical protein
MKMALFMAALLQLWALPASSSELKEAWYIFNIDPPSVVAIEPENLIEIDRTTLERNPSNVLIGPENRFLYILHNVAFDLT